ncbi:MAG: 1-pyrroline-5-carboxylate dehydrogenase [Chloroflexi bacterium HGW-Chloroflexi-9]|nr:MAG: 1-pyrroline-5-carboxylate dehydrogenase [Chloroflexi bacterium HGW-Chloroflexi-9]
MSGRSHVPTPTNEPVKGYAPGSPERAALKRELDRQAATHVEVPLRIGGQAFSTGVLGEMRMPHDHQHILGTYHRGGAAEVAWAVEAARAARPAWAAMPWEARAAIFLRAAALLAGPWRDRVNAATMLGQSKTAHQAEIDAACELIDFLNFNVHFLAGIMDGQPSSSPGVWNRQEYRPLDGFVFAVTPFNFTSIAGNLPTAPALCGNTVVWKPASAAVLSAHVLMELLEEAGLPPGVINFLPGSGAEVGDAVLAQPDLAGVHFTGGTDTFRGIWQRVGSQIDHYRQFPRLVGETGGKGFVFVHPSADPDAVVTALVRGAFEYQGQKCSAASRAYIPDTLWPQVREGLFAAIESIAVGDVRDFRNFMGAVIEESAYRRLSGVIEDARRRLGAGIVEIAGGRCDDSVGWFVEPTVAVVSDPHDRLMREEFFGPLLSVYVYDADGVEEALALCESTAPYALTGAVFARDRAAVDRASEVLRFAAGNFYVNDKPTGAVVGQQPFGGSRASGTNDKAGSPLNLLRWLSPRVTKETFDPPKAYGYPFMTEA